MESTNGPGPVEDRVAAIRRFNRLYTRRIGVLDEGHLRTRFSLAQGRVLYEIAHRDAPTAAEIGRELQLDAGYLSRLLRGLERDGLVERSPSASDARQSHLRLTAPGRAAIADLDARAHDAIAGLLAPLADGEQRRLVGAILTMEELLVPDAAARGAAPWILRPPRPGDLGWVVARNGALYAEEHGWDERYEGLVARIVADFVEQFDPRRERCWIAERGGENVGSVFLVKHPQREGVAKLRLLVVEPSARGLGIGRRLVDECTRFARQCGYHTITLWTQSILGAARHIYAAAGYRRVTEEPHHSFGHDLVAETWELAL
jgi:DNA-binding MarR family transcriptional regulator/N-acetylglutamate synthase-like GNAT family acetyltransferase